MSNEETIKDENFLYLDDMMKIIELYICDLCVHMYEVLFSNRWVL
jgi:hypothetical protein